jgi:hypothetical protein
VSGDIVERLRGHLDSMCMNNSVCDDAADAIEARDAEIERLRAEVERLREGLSTSVAHTQFLLDTYGLWSEDGVYTVPDGTTYYRYRTKSGRILTSTDIEALSAEAEQGYDITELTTKRSVVSDDEGMYTAEHSEQVMPPPSLREAGPLIAGDDAERLTAEIGRLQAVIHKTARDLYVAEIHRQGVGWDNYCVDLLVRSQHALAAASASIPRKPNSGPVSSELRNAITDLAAERAEVARLRVLITEYDNARTAWLDTPGRAPTGAAESRRLRLRAAEEALTQEVRRER